MISLWKSQRWQTPPKRQMPLGLAELGISVVLWGSESQCEWSSIKNWASASKSEWWALRLSWKSWLLMSMMSAGTKSCHPHLGWRESKALENRFMTIWVAEAAWMPVWMPVRRQLPLLEISYQSLCLNELLASASVGRQHWFFLICSWACYSVSGTASSKW